MRTEPPTGDELTRMLVHMKRNVLERAAAEPKPERNRLTDRILGGILAVGLLLGLGTAGAAIAGAVGGDGDETEAVAATSAPVTAPPTTEPPTRTFPVETAPPPAVDPLTTVSTIAVRPEGLDLVDDAGAIVAQLSYFDDPAAFADTLATVFDATPTIEDHDGWIGPDAVIWFWPGLTVGDGAYDDAENRIPISVLFTEGVVGDGVAVTAGGFTPGGDFEAHAAANGIAVDGIDERTGAPLEYGPELGPSDGEYRNAWAVMGLRTGKVFAPYNPVTRLGMRG
ncbi:hypothetical protein [Agromyces arachidis]|uniref:hypothetical protein n=1 Tax=Agromyces arachidis TaxID=766966 RepID=UPI004055A4F0